MKEKFLKAIYFISLLVSTILLFTLVDYFIHGLSPDWGVPDYYFRNKIIFAVIWFAVVWFFVRKLNRPWLQGLITAGVVVTLLQLRYYFYEGYSVSFVFEFLGFHFAILYPLAIIFYHFINIINQSKKLMSKKQVLWSVVVWF